MSAMLWRSPIRSKWAIWRLFDLFSSFLQCIVHYHSFLVASNELFGQILEYLVNNSSHSRSPPSMASHKLPSTSSLATAWCNRLNQYCEKLSKDCTNLHNIVQRKPQPGSSGDNFDIFLDDLNDDVSAALAELQHLEARTTDTLSFEELLVHCEALYQSNEDGIRKLELQLQQYGYTPVEAPKEVVNYPSHKEVETYSQSPVEAISPLISGATLSSDNTYETSASTPMTLSSQTRSAPELFQYSPLFGDLGDLENLESLGISATSLTSLAGQDEPGDSVHPLQQKLTFAESPSREVPMISSKWEVDEHENILKTKYDSHWNSQSEIALPPYPSTQTVKSSSMYGNDKHLGPVAFEKPYGIGTTNSAPPSTIPKNDVSVQSLETKSVARLDEVTVAQYESSPSWLKRQVSMQELNSAIFKINELLRQRSHAHQFVLHQDDVQALGLGSKSKACFLLLQKADKLVTQVTNGVTAYRVQI